MANRYDVAGRLAEGLPAVDDLQTYVDASQVRGYVNADLTLRGGQVREWYASEDGLNLQILDDDCAHLRTAVQAAEEALNVTRGQAGALDEAWAGSGGGTAADFIRRHCAAGAAVVDAAHRAVDACTTLRDQLWNAVDHKVEIAISIDDRTRSQRPGWLTAARAVIAGGQDETSATVIDTSVKPFVDNDIHGEWVPAMRSATAEVAAAYWVAMDTVGGRASVRFEVPGDLGPRIISTPAAVSAPAPAAAVPLRTAPMAVADPWVAADPGPPPAVAPASPVSPISTPPAAPPAPVPEPSPTPSAEFPSSTPGLESLPALGGGGSAGGGLPGRAAGLLSDLLGGAGDSGPPDSTPDPLSDNKISDAGTATDGTATDDTDGTDTDGTEDDADNVDDAAPEDTQPQEPEPTVADEVAAPLAAPAAPEAAPAPPAEAPPAPDGKTPCEIAADELPQAGR